MWSQLPPDVQQIVIGWAGETAAAFTVRVVEGLARTLRRKIQGTPAEQALERAFETGLQACMATLAPADVWRDGEHRGTLKRFFEQEEVADEFAALVDVRPDAELDLRRLRELFRQHAEELAELPDLRFDAAMKAFAQAYAEEIERSGVQQHIDQLRYLKQVVARLEAMQEEAALSREELTRIHAAIVEARDAIRLGLAHQTRVLVDAMAIYRAFPEGAVADALQELQAAIAELSETILTTVRQDTEAFRQADLETKEAAYRLLIAREFERLDFRSMLQHGQPVTLPLERVYVSLRATRRVPVADTPEIERLRRRLEEDNARRERGESPLLDDERHVELEHQLDELQQARLKEKAQPLDLNQALANPANRAMVVLGDPGAGKTTLLKYLALAFARDEAPMRLGLDERRLPIFLPLAFYDTALQEHPDLSLSDYLAGYYASEKNLPGLRPVFDAALREGRAIVLLDGLDEVLSDETRSRVSQRVESFMRQAVAQDNRVLLTSRIVGYRRAPLSADLPHFTILDMEPEAVKAFVDRWALALTCQTRGEPFERPSVEAREEAVKLAEGLKRAIEASESVRRLAVNPLLLTILAVVYTQEGMALPRRRVELYHRYARILIETWRRARTPGRFVGKEMEFLSTAKILGPLALWLQEHWPSGTAPGSRVREFLRHLFLQRLGCPPGQPPTNEQEEAAHQEAEHFLSDVREFAGVLVERGRDTYGFLHLTFQEYFAAWWLAKLEPGERLRRLQPHLHDGRWREVILLTAGQLGVVDANERLVTEFVRDILHARSEIPELHRDLLLAAACLADDVGVRLDLGREIVARLGELLRSPVPGLARAAAEALGSLGETAQARQAVQMSLAALGDGNWRVRRAAAESLGKLGDAAPEVVQALVAALRDRDEGVRWAAARSLGELGDAAPEVVQALVAALRDRDEDVRWAAAGSLVQLGRAVPEVVQALVAALRDNSWWVRQVAYEALLALAPPEARGWALAAEGREKP